VSKFDPTDDALIRRYADGVRLVDAALEGATVEDLDRLPSDGWSARMVVHHLADSEAQSYVRVRRLLAEPNPTVIQGYDEARWATTAVLGYQTEPIEGSLAVFRAVRDATSALLTRISPADLDRSGVHTESGHYSLRDWLRIYAAHGEDHAAQIAAARQGKSS
jgi:hypothetical protein